jgi:hypothetical protein
MHNVELHVLKLTLRLFGSIMISPGKRRGGATPVHVRSWQLGPEYPQSQLQPWVTDASQFVYVKELLLSAGSTVGPMIKGLMRTHTPLPLQSFGHLADAARSGWGGQE